MTKLFLPDPDCEYPRQGRRELPPWTREVKTRRRLTKGPERANPRLAARVAECRAVGGGCVSRRGHRSHYCHGPRPARQGLAARMWLVMLDDLSWQQLPTARREPVGRMLIYKRDDVNATITAKSRKPS